jgi:cell division cycle 14
MEANKKTLGPITILPK